MKSKDYNWCNKKYENVLMAAHLSNRFKGAMLKYSALYWQKMTHDTDMLGNETMSLHKLSEVKVLNRGTVQFVIP